MASSGTVTINAKSVDYTGAYASGTCYDASTASGFGRGAESADITLNWSVNDSGLLTVSYNSTSEYPYQWCVCSSNGYQIDIDWSTDGNNWSTIMTSWANNWQTCPDYCASSSYDRVNLIAQSLCAGLTPVTLSQNGYIRARMWTSRACPTAALPNAFPNDAASVATAVPVHIEVNWTSTLHYNTNGGSGGPADQTHSNSASTTSYTETVSSVAPTLTGYRFMGWADSASATTAQYHGGDTITIQKSSPTKNIYAVWEAPWTATLRYAGEGSGLPSAQSAMVDANLNSYDFTVSSVIPTRSNYRFDGWATVGGGAVAYHGGDTYTIQKSSPSKYLYAVWTAYWTATVHYDANGGTGAPADQTAVVNPDYNTKTFTVSGTEPTRTNYRFEGWSYGGNTYHGGDTVTVPANAPTANLVAIWTEFYRPGERRVSGTWSSHNRSGGACERKVSGTWTEMRTIDGGVGTGDEPTRKASGSWYNQRKLGAE